MHSMKNCCGSKQTLYLCCCNMPCHNLKPCSIVALPPYTIPFSTAVFSSSAIPIAQFPDYVKQMCQERERRMEIEHMVRGTELSPPPSL